MPSSSSVSYKFFGTYLLQQGVVTQEQLDDALKFQEKSNRRIGEMAVEKGLLSPEQVEEIFREQKIVDAPFGAIALQKKLLRQAELDDLLFSQAVQSTHLGEALLFRGYLTPEQFGRELRKFKEQEKARHESLDSLEGDPRLKVFATVLVNSFMRAYQRFAKRAVKLDSSCRDCDPSQFGLRFTLCADLGAADRMVGSFFLSEAFAKDIAARDDVAHEEQNGALTKSWLEFFSIVGRYLELELELKEEQKAQVSISGGFVQQTSALPDQGLLIGLNASRAQIVLHVGQETASV